MPTRMGYSLIAILFIFFFFGAVVIAIYLVSFTELNPLMGLIVVCPSMGFIFHHIRNLIAACSGIKPVKSPIGMMIGFSLVIILKLIIPSSMN
ncbi:MAG: hypothetical protein K8R16_06090 [Anaerolineales bacterium]|nr:hypothetical protein [Anaerolineales bacterium]